MTDIETLRRHECELTLLAYDRDGTQGGRAWRVPERDEAIAWALDAVRKAIAAESREESDYG